MKKHAQKLGKSKRKRRKKNYNVKSDRKAYKLKFRPNKSKINQIGKLKYFKNRMLSSKATALHQT